MSKQAQLRFDRKMKPKLESVLRARIDRFNIKQLRAIMVEVERSGNLPDLEQFQPELESILISHYYRVGKIFVDFIDDLVAIELGTLKSLVSVNEVEFKAHKKVRGVPVVVSRYYLARASVHSRKITDTSKRHAAQALELAKANRLATSITTVTELEIASDTGSFFRAHVNGRSVGISRLNTNAPAEAAKLTQIQLIRGEQPSLAGGGQSTGTKDWSNMGDSRVRAFGDSPFDHLSAEQTVQIDESFRVSGEQLRFPGDTGQGASIGNVINCRCSATYDIRQAARIARVQGRL